VKPALSPEVVMFKSAEFVVAPSAPNVTADVEPAPEAVIDDAFANPPTVTAPLLVDTFNVSTALRLVVVWSKPKVFPVVTVNVLSAGVTKAKFPVEAPLVTVPEVAVVELIAANEPNCPVASTEKEVALFAVIVLLKVVSSVPPAFAPLATVKATVDALLAEIEEPDVSMKELTATVKAEVSENV